MDQTVEQRILGELTQIKDSQEYQRVMLFGGKYKDLEHRGELKLLHDRIELQKAEMDLLATRMTLVEKEDDRRSSAMRATIKLCGGLATVGAIIGNLVVTYLTKAH